MVKKADFVTIVGEDRVVTSKRALSVFSPENVLVAGKPVECAVKPRGTSDVQEIVKLANDKGYALIPRSSQGLPSRGDTIPSVEGAVIVDLSEMKSIPRMDRRHKVAIIEPGVTFGELQAEAASQGMRVLMPLHPPKTKSVLASYLEREPFTIPKYHWDMTDPLMCVEVIFGSGDLFRTGSAAGPGTLEEQWAMGQAQKNPMGPGQTDFMRIIQGSQGTMGIVTWGSVKLEVLPQAQKSFFVAADNYDELLDFTYTLNKLKLPDVCVILNAVNLAMVHGSSGEEEVKELPDWALLYSVSGYEYSPWERVDYLVKDIADIAEQAGVEPVRQIAGISRDEMTELACTPSEEPYWKFRKRGWCQDIFFLTTLDRVPCFLRAMESELDKHGFAAEDLGVYVQPIRQGTNCHLEFNLMYDPSDTDDTERVKALHQSASEAFVEMGAFFSRPYGSWSDMVYRGTPETVSALRKVKGILDPKGLINPGKLCF